MRKHIFIVLLFLTSSVYLAKSQEGWKLIKNGNGILVYTKKHNESHIKMVKTIMYLHTSLSSVVTLIDDTPNHLNWVYANKTSKVLKRIDKSTTVCYGQTDLPWPVSDRDFIALVHISQDSITKEVDIISESKPDYIKETEDYIRLKNFRAVWRLTPEIEGLVRVEYELYIDPGGNIPTWLINMTIAKGPYKTMRNMQMEILLYKYKNATIPYISEYSGHNSKELSTEMDNK